MKSRDFCYWLQGLFELADPENLTPAQVKTIKNHLGMVFRHEIDPSFGGEQEQKDLNDLHEGKSPKPSRPQQHPNRLLRC